MLPAFYIDHSRVAVGFAGVVDEPRSVAMHRCVHHIKVINTKHVAADPLQKEKALGIIDACLRHKQWLLFVVILSSRPDLNILLKKSFSIKIS